MVHKYFVDLRMVWAILTLIKNILRNISSKIFEPQGDYQNVVHLSDDRDEIRNELDRTNDIKYRTAGDRLRMPRHLRMYEGSPENFELFEKMLNRAVKLLSRWLLRSVPEGFQRRNFLFRFAYGPNYTSKSYVAHSGVDHLWLACCWTIAQAVVWRAQM